ncbi:MAG: hypothetical protein JWO36_2545 [Myxococcales bacterium]|nr:hypothetical protein [Myxococcales bacterium]
MSARKFKRAVTGADDDLTPEAQGIGDKIAQAFVAGRFADVHALGTAAFQRRTNREPFVTSWRDALRDRGPLTGFEVSNAGQIDLGFIPGLEETPQDQFVAFIELAFSSPTVPLDDEKVFTVGLVLLDEGGSIRVGALHAR